MAPASEGRPAVLWGVREVVWVGLISAVWVVGSILALAVSPWAEVLENPGLLIGLLELPLLLPVAWIVFVRHRAGVGALGLRSFPRRALGYGLALLIGVYHLNCYYSLCLLAVSQAPMAETALALGSAPSPLLVFVSAAVVAPFAEEVLFRGFIFPGLAGRLGRVRAALASAGLFALAHLHPLTFPPLFALGVALAFLYDRFRSIWPCVIVHALTNGFAVTVGLLLSRYGAALP